MMRWLFFFLTGGRPMKKVAPGFRDMVTGEMVDTWEDRHGRRWLATGAWSVFRMKKDSK